MLACTACVGIVVLAPLEDARMPTHHSHESFAGVRKHCRKQHAKWLSRVDARYAGGALASDAFQRRAETYSRRMVIEVDAEGPAKQRRLSQASPDELDGFCR